MLPPVPPERIAKAPTLSQTVTSQMPEDLLAESVQRLGWVGLLYAVCYIAIDAAYRISAHAADHSFFNVLLVLGVALGCLVFVLTRWSGWPAHRILMAGLAFEVGGALLISLGELRFPPWASGEVRGLSALCAWIPIFGLLVPAGRLPSAVAAFSAAAMAPVSLAIHASGGGWPPTKDLPLLLMPPFLMAGAGVVMSQTLYRLGMRVTQEREMGSYRLVECIGRGGMGEVWRAEHRLLAREAAIKLIRQQPGGLAGGRQRFEREARAIAALQSPHTVTLFDYGATAEGSLYYVMELVSGLDLEVLVSRFGPLPAPRAAYLLAQVCASLEEAHNAGLLHRDIKPRNILAGRMGAESDFVKVLDFGLVKTMAAQDLTLTQPDSTMGTPAYMAPEMALGEPTDARADLYGVGCVGYWLLTGCIVFEAKSATAMLMEHVRKEPVPPSARTEAPVPPEMEQLILQCLAKRPEDRPQNAAELRARFQALAEGWTREDAARWWAAHQPRPEVRLASGLATTA